MKCLFTAFFLVSSIIQVFFITTSNGISHLFKKDGIDLFDFSLLKRKHRECGTMDILCLCGSTKRSVTIDVPQSVNDFLDVAVTVNDVTQCAVWCSARDFFGKSCLAPALLFSSVFGMFLKHLDLGLNVDLLKSQNSECGPTNITCPCGTAHHSLEIEVPQCKYTHLWKTRCRPCEQMTTENICPVFQFCAECKSGGEVKCSKCPRNRYGDWCEKECDCRNGAECTADGNCLCPAGLRGNKCESKKGCRLPNSVRPPLQADLQPPNAPTTIVYRCPTEYELNGISVSTCLPDGRWSSMPPKCLAKCPLLSAPAFGTLKFNGSELVEGVTAEIFCDENHRLVGQRRLICLPTGIWSAEVPRCVELALCSDPGNVPYAQKTVLPGIPKSGGYYLQEAKIEYQCDPGFEQMGTDRILCLFDGTWSQELPICIKVSTLVLNCHTTGSEVVAEVGVPVRILCPPECATKEVKVWGTSIYRMQSAICPAAVHAGKVTNTGGQLSVISNGGYTNFAGSLINDVQSKNYDGRDESFRFDKVGLLFQGRETEGGCAKGLLRLDTTCVHISSTPLPENKAEAVCINLGLRMGIPSSLEDQRALLMFLTSKGINDLWTEQSRRGTNSSYNVRPRPRSIQLGNRSINSYDAPPALTNQAGDKCRSVSTQHTEFTRRSVSCNMYLHFVCMHSPSSRILASCTDPGALKGGTASPIGKIDDEFFVGSSIEYNCEPLHYLKGTAKLFCRGNGTWSDEKPTCIRVDTCEEPPVSFAAVVNYLPPLETPVAQRTAIRYTGREGFRRARLPVGLNGKPPPQIMLSTSTTTPGPEANIVLPPGQHKVGTRAMYDCESRYYQLVGSRSRRCQGQGQWSGRAPTCMPVCGRSDSPRTPFIVNGNASDIGQWPWQAGIARYIQDYNNWFLLCGASLLTERWVITAAHCITYAGTTLPIDPDKFRVYLGKYHRDDAKDDEFVQIKAIHEVHIHPDYDPGIFDADIALMQLTEPVQLNSRVQPVCLPSEETSVQNLKPNSRGVVTGWGMNENESYSETLQQAVLPVVSNEECEKGYEESELPLMVTKNMFCAGFKQGKMDACSGDSGGPIVFLDDTSKERKWVLEGIVSWGSPKGCGHANQYGGFTVVSKFLNWIHLYF